MVGELVRSYVVTAKAKSLDERRVIEHAKKNSLISVFTFSGILFVSMLTGVVVAEYVHGPERLRRLYRLKSSVERVNSRLTALLSRITFKGLKAAATQVSYAILGILFVAWTDIKTRRPEKARGITYYV